MITLVADMTHCLLAWIGENDLAASKGKYPGLGSIAAAAIDRRPDSIVLLSNWGHAIDSVYRRWLRTRTGVEIRIERCRLSGPMAFAEIHSHARRVADAVLESTGSGGRLILDLSSGSPAMASIWLLLGKTRYLDRAELIQVSLKSGVLTADLPFDISAEFQDFVRRGDEELIRLTQGLPPETPEFEAIVHRSAVMDRIIAKARQLARHDLPVLIQGESGTGKELFARAIHSASLRSKRPFVPLNCGSIPADLIDSELFGHRKGSFTGAVDDRAGVFEAASGGTLFLDEVGELSKAAQVRLLRALQEGRIRRVGEQRERPVDVRAIAATNRKLIFEMASGNFREDLFHRLAVGFLEIPPLRERSGDGIVLIEHELEQLSAQGLPRKRLSAEARSALLAYSWPGNVRELRNVLTRAVVFSSRATLRGMDIRDAMLASPTQGSETILGRTIGNGFRIEAVLAEVAGAYLARALESTGGNKARAARLLGLSSSQTLGNWLVRFGAVHPTTD